MKHLHENGLIVHICLFYVVVLSYKPCAFIYEHPKT